MTSLAFMLVEVPLPVWKTSIGNSSSSSPSATARARLLDRRRRSRREQAELAIDSCRGQLHQAERVDELRRQRLAGDREVLDGALRCGAVERVGR